MIICKQAMAQVAFQQQIADDARLKLTFLTFYIVYVAPAAVTKRFFFHKL